MAEDQAVAAAREAALRLLERARRTRRELERKLRDSGHERSDVAQALDRLQDVGLIDDLETAKAFVRAQWAKRASSAQLIRRRLVARGITPAIVAEALSALDAEAGPAADPLRRSTAEGERARASRAAQTLGRRYLKLEPRVARARLTAALARRGFGRDAIAHALRTALDTPEPAT